MNKNTSFYFRLIHRYLGFYLVGIMAVYAISGIAMIFRNDDTFKILENTETTLAVNLDEKTLGEVLEIKGLSILKQEGSLLFFEDGTYNQATGETIYVKKELPFLLDKMAQLHKATTNSPIYWLNIFFGVSLLFFVISSFWMFLPHTSVFKKGIYFTLAGIVMTLIILFV
ncbi:MAG: hypothetical protein ACKVJM_05060 [Flavobacteriales bacterium]|nr:hypothetical protein [Flavobacteriaceae bacterium]|tara:strand:+ start:4445 stop:4954 length:510 start_codon:yes stop_codon:yes gene_type:complete